MIDWVFIAYFKIVMRLIFLSGANVPRSTTIILYYLFNILFGFFWPPLNAILYLLKKKGVRYTMFRILIAEDDPSTARLLSAILKRDGYEPLTAADGVEALEMLDHNHIDLLLCDVMMPRMDGFALTKAIRDSGCMLPILMLTAKDMPQDKHTGFIVGTDDYMTKPPDRQELLLRIRALLRRARIVDEHKITVGDVELDYDTHTVRRGHDAQVLPPKEFNLLYKLLAYPEKTFTRLELLDEIWGMDSESDDKTVNVHINRLRTRFYDWPEFEIQTVRGIGYRAVKKV